MKQNNNNNKTYIEKMCIIQQGLKPSKNFHEFVVCVCVLCVCVCVHLFMTKYRVSSSILKPHIMHATARFDVESPYLYINSILHKVIIGHLRVHLSGTTICGIDFQSRVPNSSMIDNFYELNSIRFILSDICQGNYLYYL